MIVSLKSFPRLTSKVSFKKLFARDSFKEVTGSDLFYQLTYMAAVAAAGISRSRIFAMGGNLQRAPSAYFSRVHLLSQKLGYDYAHACATVGLAIKSEAMVSLLLRFASALTSGQPEKDFLSEEALVQSKAYEKEYERDLASLTKWTDAYAAVTVSATLIVVINMTSSLIYPLSNAMLLTLVFTAIATTGATAWIMGRAAPKEVIDIFSPEGPWTQRTALKIVYYVIGGIFIICPLLWLLEIDIGWLTLVAALLLLPLGGISMLAGREIDKKDRELGPFLRSLGSMAVSTGTTLTEALTRIDISSFPALEPDLARLRNRMAAAIEPDLCWQKFALETGSKLIGETVKVFNDAVRLGADPDTIGFLAADFSARTIMLRAKRKVTASTFTWLTIAMHGTVSGLMLLMLEIVINFVTRMSEATATLDEQALAAFASALPIFNAPQLGFYRLMTVSMVLILAITNAIAINNTDGGHKLKMTFYISIMLCLSGVGILAAPPIVAAIL